MSLLRQMCLGRAFVEMWNRKTVNEETRRAGKWHAHNGAHCKWSLMATMPIHKAQQMRDFGLYLFNPTVFFSSSSFILFFLSRIGYTLRVEFENNHQNGTQKQNAWGLEIGVLALFPILGFKSIKPTDSIKHFFSLHFSHFSERLRRFFTHFFRYHHVATIHDVHGAKHLGAIRDRNRIAKHPIH